MYKYVCPSSYSRYLISAWYTLLSEYEFQRVERWMWSCPLLSIHRSSFRPGWSGVLAKEVGGKLKPEAPGIGPKGIEECEVVLGAEESVG